MLMAIIVLAGLGIIFGIFLTYFHTRFHVEENPIIPRIYELMPKANCGACGFPGCSSFVEALIEGKTPIEKCALLDAENRGKICEILGIEVKEKERKVARVLCFGGVNAKRKFSFDTIKSCSAVNSLFDTNLECNFGCIGYGDCVKVCPVNAIKIGEKGVPEIDEEICVGCGKCVDVCPKNIVKLLPYEKKVYVSCSSRDKGAVVVKICKTGCIGCGKCVRVCPAGAIKIENNLAVIDYEKCESCGKCVEECPRKIIFQSSKKIPQLA